MTDALYSYPKKVLQAWKWFLLPILQTGIGSTLSRSSAHRTQDSVEFATLSLRVVNSDGDFFFPQYDILLEIHGGLDKISRVSYSSRMEMNDDSAVSRPTFTPHPGIAQEACASLIHDALIQPHA